MNRSGPVGATVNILGTGFTSATGVKIGGTAASFHVVSDSLLTAKVPAGTTGPVTVATSGVTLQGAALSKSHPVLPRLVPPSGKVNDSIVITGTGLIQTAAITVGKGTVDNFITNSDTKVTFIVPTTATTGKITVTTLGGEATSAATFTVTP